MDKQQALSWRELVISKWAMQKQAQAKKCISGEELPRKSKNNKFKNQWLLVCIREFDDALCWVRPLVQHTVCCQFWYNLSSVSGRVSSHPYVEIPGGSFIEVQTGRNPTCLPWSEAVRCGQGRKWETRRNYSISRRDSSCMSWLWDSVAVGWLLLSV